MFSRKGIAFGLLCMLLACAALSLAPQSTSGGAISITVVSSDGKRIPDASVVFMSADGSTQRLTPTDDGSYTAANLPSGNYLISAQAFGFNPLQNVSAAVAIGRTTHLDLHLQITSTKQSVNVSAQPTVLDLSQTSSVLNIDRDRIEELPTRSRDYLSFVLLSPQAAPANPVLANQNTATSFSFGGLRSGSNAIYIDEVSDNDEYSGGSRTQLSPEAVSDFQIVNHGFSAQAGGAAGGSIDVQTRLGTNHLHGDAFVFLQNAALNAAPPLTHTLSKPNDNRLRTGLALGGPIHRDRTFFYAAAEQEIAHGQDARDLSAATIHAINNAISTYAPLANAPLHAGFSPTEDHETELSARIGCVRPE